MSRPKKIADKKDYLFISPEPKYPWEKFVSLLDNVFPINKVFKLLLINKKYCLVGEGGGMRSFIYLMGIFHSFHKYNFLTGDSKHKLLYAIGGSSAALTEAGFLSSRKMFESDSVGELFDFLAHSINSGMAVKLQTLKHNFIKVKDDDKMVFPVRKIVEYLIARDFINLDNLAQSRTKFIITSTNSATGQTVYHDINSCLKKNGHLQVIEALVATSSILFFSNDYGLLGNQWHVDGEILNKIPFDFLVKKFMVPYENMLMITSHKKKARSSYEKKLFGLIFKHSKVTRRSPNLLNRQKELPAIHQKRYQEVKLLAEGSFPDAFGIPRKSDVAFLPDDFVVERDTNVLDKMWEGYAVAQRVGLEILHSKGIQLDREDLVKISEVNQRTKR